MTYCCHECCGTFEVPYAVNGTRITKRPTCPGCGPGTMVTWLAPERERGDDDGVEYSDPRDRRRGLE